ncbi:MAG: hypothetical protein C0501_26750 [Isosphaera sp.]|nr:hypothetical protein [Isosphaera sp.]
MSIVVPCPHCGTKSNLPDDTAGKAIRCPNLDCRKVFTVRPVGKPTEPPAPPPVARPSPIPDKPPAAKKPARPAAPKVVEAKVVEAAVVAPPKVKEVVWTEGADVPPPKGKKPVRAAAAEEPDEPDDLPVRRRRKKQRGPWLLIGMCVVILSLIGFGVVYVLRFQGETEAAAAKEADDQYKKGEYAAAGKAFEKLAADYPDGESGARYKFFADLSGMRQAVGAVTNREDPEPALGRLRKFIEAQKDNPLAKPTSGFGRDVLEAGKRVGEDIAAHAGDRVKAYREDRANKSGELDRADKAVAAGRGLLPLLAPFKAPDDPPLDSLARAFDAVEAEVKKERDRSAALAKAAGLLKPVSDAAVQQAEADLAAAGLAEDADAKTLLAAARGELRDLVRYEEDPAPPRAAPAGTAASVLFVAPVGADRRPPARAGDPPPPAVFLAVARGILYALDEDTGALVWAVRVGPDVTDPPAVTRVDVDGVPTDLAVVASNVGGEAAVAAYVVRTGQPRWYQPLPAPAAGPAAVVGGRAFVAVRDAVGTVFEFDLTTGFRKGKIRLGQPAGPAVVARPGTGLLYAAADARRVYVLDVGSRTDDGVPVPPRCVQVIATGHPSGTLRTPPVLVGPAGDAPAERWMVLSQADGPTTTKVRAFLLPAVEPPPADGKAPPETPAVPAVEPAVPGWVWFPPATDGEWLAVVTDAGQLRLFGVNQPGNFDKALFPVPAPALPPPPDGTAVPGLVLLGDESEFWALANGVLQRFRVSLIPTKELGGTPVEPKVPVGVPTQAPQLNAARDAACLVVRSADGAGHRAVLVSLRDGEVRWKRQLGVVPAAPPVPLRDGGVLVVGEDGGAVAVPAGGGAAPGQTTVAPPAWAAADAPEGATGPTAVAVSADGQTVFTVTPVVTTEDGKTAARYVVRRVVNGQVAHAGAAVAPGPLAGLPVVLGDALLIPAADGFVYRHAPGTGRANPDTFTLGPKWAADAKPGDAVCHLTPLSDTAFLASDGGKRLARWEWGKAGPPTAAGGWDLRERPTGPGVALPPAAAGEPARVLVADVTGGVSLYADRGGQPLRRWRPGKDGVPVGKVTSRLAVQPDAAGRRVVAYTVEGAAVCLDPDRDAPKWVVKAGDEADAALVGAPQPAGGGRWLLTDLGGRVRVVDAGGGAAGELPAGVSGAVPAAAAGSAGGGAALLPLSDGSAVVLTVPVAPEPIPEPKPKPKE